jgi:hypothetical protein
MQEDFFAGLIWQKTTQGAKIIFFLVFTFFG